VKHLSFIKVLNDNINKSKVYSRTDREGPLGEWMCRAGGQPHLPAALPLGRRLGTLCAGGWMDARVILDECRKADSYWNTIPKQCSPEQVCYTNYTILAHPKL